MNVETGAPASETPAAAPAANPAPSATSELSTGAAPGADGGVVSEQTQQPEDQQPPAAEPATPQERPSRFDKRFSDLSKQVREEREARIRAEAERDTVLRMGIRPQEQPAPQAPAAPAGPPDPNDRAKYPEGKYDPRYAVDLAKHEIAEDHRKEREAATAAERRAAEHSSLQEGLTRLNSTIEKAKTIADGEGGEFFQNAPSVLELAFVPVSRGGLPKHVADAITESDNNVHVAELLGRKPEAIHESLRPYVKDLKSLAALPEAQAVRAITKLDERIGILLEQSRARAAAAPAQPRPAPQASPAPIPTVTPSGAAPSFNPDTASQAEWDAHFSRLRAASAGAH